MAQNGKPTSKSNGKSNGTRNGDAAPWVGRKLKRKEDPRLIQGISHYTDDLKLPRMLHCVLVRSPYAHAEVGAIRTDAARAVHGVVGVFTAEDVSSIGMVPCAIQMPDLKVPKHPVLATERVRYVGEPVAVVVAEDLYAARDAAELVEVDYEPLHVITNMEKALGNETSYVHEEFRSNKAFTHALKNGDIAAAFKKADRVVKQRMINQRLAPIAMETRAVLAEYLPGEKRLTVWNSTQIPQLTALMLAGCYKFPAIDIEIQGVFTNKMSTDAYRGAGRPEATYIVERIMDIAAHELNIDSAEFRLKNFPQSKEFPFNTVTGLTYDSAKYQESLKKALQLAGYDALRRRQKNGLKQGKYYGVGVSTYVEICAIGPSAATPAGGWESATVRIEPTGKVTLLTGASSHGQGEETTFAQLIADQLGIDPDDVNVVHGDTLAVPYGIGTFGSRATAVGGP